MYMHKFYALYIIYQYMLSLARAIVERKHDSYPRAAMAHYSAPAQKLKEAVSISSVRLSYSSIKTQPFFIINQPILLAKITKYRL